MNFKLSLLLLAIVLTGCSKDQPTTASSSNAPNGSQASAAPGAPTKVSGSGVTTSSGLQYWDLVTGSGATAAAGKQVKVQYTGWLADGTKFDSSFDHGQPIAFILGEGNVIRGWDEGLVGMKVGGKRQLRIPPQLGYGDRPMAAIPPHSTLIFDVELLGVE